jgi:hypothetical protein
MNAGKHASASPAASLDEQILEVERRLIRRHASSTSNRAAIRRHVRETISSPLTLLLAAGVGFAMGHFRRPHTARSSVTDTAGGTGGALSLSTMLSAVSLAGSIMTLLQRIRDEGRSPPPHAEPLPDSESERKLRASAPR